MKSDRSNKFDFTHVQVHSTLLKSSVASILLLNPQKQCDYNY